MSDTRTLSRRIDNGDPLILWDPPGEDGPAGYAVSTGVCHDPECPCTTMRLAFQAARRSGDGIVEFGGLAIEGEVLADGSGLTLGKDTAGVLPGGNTGWIREQMNEEDHRDWLAERWRRLRGQIGDPAYPSGVPPDDVDELIPFFEMFPGDFDLTVAHERRLYLASDYYCLDPECTCDDVVVHFDDLSRGPGNDTGHVRASVRRLRVASIEGTPVVRALWNELLEEYGPDPLQDRFRRMRDLALSRARPARQVEAPKARRNDPCPCGSGKKFKRCCGA